MRELSYQSFLNKVYGCFLGKAVSGNIGAPHEGVKMAMELPFLPSMIDCERPNDDLDLQVLWLSVAEEKGPDFTSRDLLRSFAENCDYSPGEYAVMRKNYERGIDPPLSGSFCNSVYREGMGCPIRSEIWACLAAGNACLAAEFAFRDGALDHEGDSIHAERFLAALESEAFFTDDLRYLLRFALAFVPEESRFRRLVEDTVKWCDEIGDPKLVREKILFSYGHPDCTNLYQNMGILLAALLLGEGDILKTAMITVNAGFDTDCTAATAGAILGLLKGAEALNNAYGLSDATFALGVRCKRRSDRIEDLAEDIALLAVEFAKSVNTETVFTGAPETRYEFAPLPDWETRVYYEENRPYIALDGERRVKVLIKSRSPKTALFRVSAEGEHGIKVTSDEVALSVPAGGEAEIGLTIALAADAPEVYEKNRIRVTFDGAEGSFVSEFGIVGATPWKFSGPFWKTEPLITTEKILSHIEEAFPYKALMDESGYGENLTDKKRHFHLNFSPDTETEFLTEEALFIPVREDFRAPDHEEKLVFTPEDNFRLSDFTGFQGPCAAYLSRTIVLDEEEEVFLQIGMSAPFALYLNGECIAKRDRAEYWTGENVHVENVRMRKGENRLVFRMTRLNRDDLYNVTFSRGKTCARHIVTWRTKNPAL